MSDKHPCPFHIGVPPPPCRIFTCGENFQLNSLLEKLSSIWSNQAGKIILAAGQYDLCLALTETPTNGGYIIILLKISELT